MKGQLYVQNETPCVKVDDKNIYPLGCCKLTKHTNGSWNFNMSISGNYTAYKQGDKVDGSIINGIFYAWTLLR